MSVKRTDYEKLSQPILPRGFVSGIRDNHTRGTIGELLKEKTKPNSTLSVVSAYFTIYAFDALKDALAEIDRMNFLFGEPRFLKTIDPNRSDRKAFIIEDEGLKLANRLEQKRVARECSEWIRDKVDIRSVNQTNFLHGKMYHINDGAREHAIVGSSNFTVSGLGLGLANNIELKRSWLAIVPTKERQRQDREKGRLLNQATANLTASSLRTSNLITSTRILNGGRDCSSPIAQYQDKLDR